MKIVTSAKKSLFIVCFFITANAFAQHKSADLLKDKRAVKIEKNNTSSAWVGTWSTAPQLVEPNNMPPQPGLTNNTLRQIVRVSIGGDSLKVRFSNEFSTSAVTLKTVRIAVSTGEYNFNASTSKDLTFNGINEVTLKVNDVISSDPIAFKLKPRMDIAITINFGQTSATVTGHPGSRTTSYLLAGNSDNSTDFSGAIKTDHWYIINGIDVKSQKNEASVAILGNSITDGRGSGTNKQNRWPDILSEQLLKNTGTQNVAVLNLGIGGNCVLKDCLGASAIDRYDRDILNQHGLHWIIIMEAINDIGQTRDSIDAQLIADNLIAAYAKMIEKAHSKNLIIYGATILPFKSSFYYADFREKARAKVNNWIRKSGRFDAVIDFDKALRNPTDTLTLLPNLHTGDFLHPNEAGYKAMGETIDLNLFK